MIQSNDILFEEKLSLFKKNILKYYDKKVQKEECLNLNYINYLCLKYCNQTYEDIILKKDCDALDILIKNTK